MKSSSSGGRTAFPKTLGFFAVVVVVASFVFLDSCGTVAETTAAAAAAAAAAASDGATPETLELRSRRHAADQRMAEIQALLALGKMRGGGGGDDPLMIYGHGMVDPHNIGRRNNRFQPNRERNPIESQQINDQEMDSKDNLFPEESK